MKIADHLNNEHKRKHEQIKKPKKKAKSKPKKEEKVDWADIMGVNRDTYKRNRGAIRRK